MSVRRALIWGLPTVIAVGGIVGYRAAVAELKTQVETALGPESQIESLAVGWSGVTVTGLRIRAPSGWPVEDTLRAKRVTITPSVSAAMMGKLRISSIVVLEPYVSVLRTRNETVRVLPSLIEAKPKPSVSGAPGPEVTLARIELRNGAVDFFDASVQQPALKIGVREIALTVTNLTVPGLRGRSDIDFSGLIQGKRHDGRVEIHGWADIGSRDSSIQTRLRGVDLVALQPYLIRSAEAGVDAGTLDFDVQSEVREKKMKAPGRMVLSDLKLSENSGSFMGLPRQAVLFFLKDKDGRIAVDFTLAGDINNPEFSLNEMLSTQIAAAIAKVMGVSLSGVVEALGTVGQGGAAVLDEAARGVNKAFQGFFGDAPAESKDKKP